MSLSILAQNRTSFELYELGAGLKSRSISIECPPGDFMGLAHGKITSYESAVHSVGKNAAFNFWLPMPFESNAKVTLTNESDMAFIIYYS